MDLSPEHYCRQLEAYLCRKNDGHLVRIVGPAFEQVCGWATRGVPLKVAQRGIDRYFERYYARGPRRRPVRIEFCEADVLDLFDEWRRAVGLGTRDVASAAAPADAEPTAAASVDEGHRRHGSLPAHLDRAIARLTSVRAGEDRSLDAVLDAIVGELDTARAAAKTLRGEARAAFLERLAGLDAAMIAAARARCDESTVARLATEADLELAPFRARMPADAYDRARAACIDRAVRERFRLPILTFE